MLLVVLVAEESSWLSVNNMVEEQYLYFSPPSCSNAICQQQYHRRRILLLGWSQLFVQPTISQYNQQYRRRRLSVNNIVQDFVVGIPLRLLRLESVSVRMTLEWQPLKNNTHNATKMIGKLQKAIGNIHPKIKRLVLSIKSKMSM